MFDCILYDLIIYCLKIYVYLKEYQLFQALNQRLNQLLTENPNLKINLFVN